MPTVLHSESELRDAAELAVETARRLGADSSVIARSSTGATVTAREGAVESAVQDAHQSVQVTIHRDGKSGSAGTSSLTREALERAVTEADAIARVVQPDPHGGLPDPSWLANRREELALYEHDPRGPAALIEMALAIDVAGSGSQWRVTEAGAVSSEGIWALATSAGFSRSARSSDQGRWCMVLASDEQGSIVDFFESRDRRHADLAAPEMIARAAIERALAARNARALSSRRVPVLFEPRVAVAIIWDLVGALTGTAQYRRSTFLQDPLGTQVTSTHLDLEEDPFEPFGLASGAFDSDGVAGTPRCVIEAGVANGLFLGARSARQLGLRSTGNADGPYNLKLIDRGEPATRSDLVRKMGSGLIVTQLAGGATNPVTGGWTRAVRGHWVENGETAHAVQDVTLAGEMGTMLKGILAVGTDVERNGAIRVGSVLIDEMQVGGAA
jgi:PmbA protein